MSPYYAAGRPYLAVGAIWAAWALSWLIAAVWSKRTQGRPGIGSEVPYRVVTVIGALLLFNGGRLGAGTGLWRPPLPIQWTLVALTGAGFAFCWLARIQLGSLWSGSVTRKEGHRIVDTGPYALVRHPIYTGLIVASAATAALSGTWTSIFGFGLLTLGFWIKARLEETFLRAELGPQGYDAYARRTRMLLPFL